MMLDKISILIPCFNSELTIRKTLESVKWADEIFICDSFSTDRTLEIAREYGATIVQHPYENAAAQKNWAIPQCRNKWILQLDADEALEENAKEEIETHFQSLNPHVQAFKFRRKNFAFEKWLAHGAFYPDYQKRLFLRDIGRFQNVEIHEHLDVPGEVIALRGHILHYDFKDLSTWLVKFERYMRYECNELIKKGRKFSLSRVTFYPAAVFMNNYILKKGFLDGWFGFFGAVMDGFYYFIKYMKLWEYEWHLKNKK